MTVSSLRTVFQEACLEWLEDNAMRLSSSLAYYALFSLAPLVVLVVAIAGMAFGEEAARGQLAQNISALAGRKTAEALQAAVLASASQKAKGLVATIVSLLVMLFGASTVFAELKDSMNTIWGVVVKPGRPILELVRSRFLSFTIVLMIGFLLLASLVLSVTLASFAHFMSGRLKIPAVFWQMSDFGVSIAVVTGLFALLFKFLPNVRLAWRDVWLGAMGTGLLFTLGKTVIGFYLATSGISSMFGAAGSVVMVLAWVYYSACIFFFGVEITKVYARNFGSGIVPNSRAVLVLDLIRAKLADSGSR